MSLLVCIATELEGGLAAGVLVATLLFAAILAINRLFVAEREEGGFELIRLAPLDRTVLVLRFWEDLSVEQTAAMMRTSSSAVRTRSSRALTKLRGVLGASGLAELTAR